MPIDALLALLHAILHILRSGANMVQSNAGQTHQFTLDLQLELAQLPLMLLLQVCPSPAFMVQAAHLSRKLLLQHCNVMPELLLHMKSAC